MIDSSANIQNIIKIFALSFQRIGCNESCNFKYGINIRLTNSSLNKGYKTHEPEYIEHRYDIEDGYQVLK